MTKKKAKTYESLSQMRCKPVCLCLCLWITDQTLRLNHQKTALGTFGPFRALIQKQSGNCKFRGICASAPIRVNLLTLTCLTWLKFNSPGNDCPRLCFNHLKTATDQNAHIQRLPSDNRPLSNPPVTSL